MIIKNWSREMKSGFLKLMVPLLVGAVLRFHSHNIAHTPAEITAAGGDESTLPAKSIWWQGNEYKAWPCQINGLEKSTTGSGATPKLTVANLDGSITALCLAYDDLLKATVTIHDTLAQYLDARNFPSGNATADPTQEKLQVWYIDGKNTETSEAIEFRLTSPMDLQGLMIPTRQLHSLCPGVFVVNTAAVMAVIMQARTTSTKTTTRWQILHWTSATAR
jgi:lambda family phage minor tail protein L